MNVEDFLIHSKEFATRRQTKVSPSHIYTRLRRAIIFLSDLQAAIHIMCKVDVYFRR